MKKTLLGLTGLVASLCTAEQITQFPPSRIADIKYSNNTLYISNNQYKDNGDFSFDIYSLNLDTGVLEKLVDTLENSYPQAVGGGRVAVWSRNQIDRKEEILIHPDNLIFSSDRFRDVSINSSGDVTIFIDSFDVQNIIYLPRDNIQPISIPFNSRELRWVGVEEDGSILVQRYDTENYKRVMSRVNLNGEILYDIDFTLPGFGDDFELEQKIGDFYVARSSDSERYSNNVFHHLLKDRGSDISAVFGLSNRSHIYSVGPRSFLIQSRDFADFQGRVFDEEEIYFITIGEEVYRVNDGIFYRQSANSIAVKDENSVFFIDTTPVPTGWQDQVRRVSIHDIATKVTFDENVSIRIGAEPGQIILEYNTKDPQKVTVQESRDLQNWDDKFGFSDVLVPPKTFLPFSYTDNQPGPRFFRIKKE